MKTTTKILLTGLVLIILYNLFLFIYPLNKRIFYTNEERIEAYLYGKSESIVLVGSSLSGAFQDISPIDGQYFNLYLPFTGSLTGLKVIEEKQDKPKIVFIEINHIDRGIDTALIGKTIETPMFEVRKYIPMFLTQNKLYNNILDRIIKPKDSKTNETRPVATLYNKLLETASKEWENLNDSVRLKTNFEQCAEKLKRLSQLGVKIVLFEMPIEQQLTHSKRAEYQRNYFKRLAILQGYSFIDNDPNSIYETGDGVHLLKASAERYSNYMKKTIQEAQLLKNLLN